MKAKLTLKRALQLRYPSFPIKQTYFYSISLVRCQTSPSSAFDSHKERTEPFAANPPIISADSLLKSSQIGSKIEHNIAVPINDSDSGEDEEDVDDSDFDDVDEGDDNNGMFRITKLISETGYCSRRVAEKFIRERRVSLKGKTVRSSALLVDPADLRYIELDGLPLKRQYQRPAPPSSSSSSSTKTSNSTNSYAETSFLYPRVWAAIKYRFEGMNNKEAFGKKRPVLMERLQVMMPKVFNASNMNNIRPVYRLTYKSEGLTLYTDNGELARLFHSPQLNLLMTYRLRLHGTLKPEKVEAIKQGKIHMKDGKKMVQFEEFRVDAKGSTNSWITVKTYEKDVKKIEQTFDMVYLQCTRLICVGIGPYSLSNIFPGLYNYANQKSERSPSQKEEQKQQTQVKEVPVDRDLHKLFLQLQNNRVSRKETKVKNPSSLA